MSTHARPQLLSDFTYADAKEIFVAEEPYRLQHLNNAAIGLAEVPAVECFVNNMHIKDLKRARVYVGCAVANHAFWRKNEPVAILQAVVKEAILLFAFDLTDPDTRTLLKCNGEAGYLVVNARPWSRTRKKVHQIRLELGGDVNELLERTQGLVPQSAPAFKYCGGIALQNAARRLVDQNVERMRWGDVYLTLCITQAHETWQPPPPAYGGNSGGDDDLPF